MQFRAFNRYLILTTGILCSLGITRAGFPHVPGDSTWRLPDSHTPEQFYQEIDSLYLTGDYTEVLEKTFLLLRFFEESGNLSGEVNCYNILGDVMRAISDYSGSLGYLKKSLELTAQPQDSLLRVTTYCLIAATYFELNQPFHIDSAWKYASLSYRLAKQKADKLTQLRNLNILGMVELFKGRFPSSYTYLRQALDIAKQNRPDDIPLVRVNLSKYYDTTGNRREAISLALQAYAEAKRMNILVYRRLSAFALTEYFNKEGDYRRALKYMTDLFQTTSHILWEKKEGWVFNLKMQTERLRKEHELELLKSQEKKHIDDLNERTYWLILSIVLICGLIFFTILFGQQKRKLKQLNLELDKTNARLKKFISIIAHDLKSPFNTILGYTNILISESDTLTPQEQRMAVENAHKSAVNAFALLEQLLNWEKVQNGNFNPEFSEIDISNLIDDVISLIQTTAFLKKQKISNKVPVALKVWADRNMMLTVFRNLLSNAIKFTPEEGFIDFSGTASGEFIEIVVRDTGIGIPASEIGKLFRLDEQFRSKGTQGEKGTGLGLLLCREYLEKNHGTITVESTEGEGTAFKIRLPKMKSDRK